MAEQQAKQSFSLENFQNKKVFASFLPGIAGLYGIPAWVFYCNRAQAICSFGIADKDHAMMEFYPANKSYERVSSHGFRTFIKIDDGTVYEPFTHDRNSKTKMSFDPAVLCLEDRNEEIGITTRVEYAIVPQEDFAALIRSVTIENNGAERNFEIIDGMPELLPCGIPMQTIKNMSNTAKAWAVVDWVEDLSLYTTRGVVGDSETVEEMKKVFFFFSKLDGQQNKDIIVDRKLVFGPCLDLSRPLAFEQEGLRKILSETQNQQNSYASAFSCTEARLKHKGTLHFESYFGYAENKERVGTIRKILGENNAVSLVSKSRAELTNVIQEIETSTRYKSFDAYCGQNYLDNVLRGGYPLVFDHKDGKFVYHVYSRKHGDLERDYNAFYLEPLPISQGNGNFRDMCQNRRNDVYFHPEAGLQNIRIFVNLLQIDAYNPLNIRGLRCSLKKSDIDSIEKESGLRFDTAFRSLLADFSPGACYSQLTSKYKKELTSEAKRRALLNRILYSCDFSEQADYGEGYWIDHFTYILDLLESYEEIYPDTMSQVLLESTYRFFDSPVRVRSRKEKYLSVNGSLEQHDAVEHLEDKEEMQEKRGHRFLVDSTGEIYHASLLEKLLCLVCNKISSLDSCGFGLEMEAGKPGWNDALNGMPSILGSGVSELFELKRIVVFLQKSLSQFVGKTFLLNTVIVTFARSLQDLFEKEPSNSTRWNAASELRESFRAKTIYAIDPKKEEMQEAGLRAILDAFSQVLDRAISGLKEYKDSIVPSFFEYNAALSKDGVPENLEDITFRARALPTFLEAPAKSMTFLTREENKKLFQQIKQSDIYDKKLKMYKTSESLEQESIKIGRARSFSPGWLEREAIFMHMEFKYMLQLLETGLYKEFYDSIHTVFPCFMDVEQYGRSIYENSSFIASSVHPDTSIHGQGFSARLSGSTAEFLSIWKHLCFGKQLFRYDPARKELCFQPSPKFDASFFSEQGLIQSRLFSTIKVSIQNTEGVHCYQAEPKTIHVDGKEYTAGSVCGSIAEDIRSMRVSEICIIYE